MNNYVILDLMSISEYAKIKHVTRKAVQERIENDCSMLRYLVCVNERGKSVIKIQPSILNEAEQQELIQMRKQRKCKRDIYLVE